jgi:hypothetical protein
MFDQSYNNVQPDCGCIPVLSIECEECELARERRLHFQAFQGRIAAIEGMLKHNGMTQRRAAAARREAEIEFGVSVPY